MNTSCQINNGHQFLFSLENLPKVSEEERLHAVKVYEFIKAKIEDQGNITFSQYMEQALYTPGLGYYSSGKMLFGKDGDFITAPLISKYFGTCIARFYLKIIESIPQKNILEFGAGTGKLALDLLSYLQEHNEFIEHYYILEPSSALQIQQRETLKIFINKITWLQTLPEKFNGLVIANEVLDAFPVERITIENKQIKQSHIRINKNGEFEEYFIETDNPKLLSTGNKISQNLGVECCFAQRTMTASDDKNAHITNEITTGADENTYITEVNSLLAPWLAALGHKLEQAVVLLIDYGFSEADYYHSSRNNGTLKCHFKHHAHNNPFILPGIQDITAHVNFTEVAQYAHKFGFDIQGYTTQAHFLMETGLMDILADSSPSIAISQQLKKLLLPEEMGELFKVIAVSKNIDANIPGFTMDMSHGL